MLTKIDIMDPGTNCRDVLEGQTYQLRNGWIGVVNRGQADINSKVRQAGVLNGLMGWGVVGLAVVCHFYSVLHLLAAEHRMLGLTPAAVQHDASGAAFPAALPLPQPSQHQPCSCFVCAFLCMARSAIGAFQPALWHLCSARPVQRCYATTNYPHCHPCCRPWHFRLRRCQ